MLIKEDPTKLSTMSGYKPMRNVRKPNGKKMKNSRLSRSLKNTIECCLTFPKIIRLHNHRLYPAPRTIPAPAKSALQLFTLKQPTITKNSPTKLLVQGRPKLANVNIIKKTEKSGIVCIKPL
jgi:hypothetical protein